MNSFEIGTKLREIAIEYTDAADKCVMIDTHDMLNRGAAQVRFVAVMVSTAADGFYDDLGLAWIEAGRRLLDPLLERARMDEVHASRAERRDEQLARIDAAVERVEVATSKLVRS